MTFEWLIWWGLALGLTYQQAHDIPVGELLDLIRVDGIQHGRIKAQIALDDEDIIPNVR